jgi:hypothetical protein
LGRIREREGKYDRLSQRSFYGTVVIAIIRRCRRIRCGVWGRARQTRRPTMRGRSRGPWSLWKVCILERGLGSWVASQIKFWRRPRCYTPALCCPELLSAAECLRICAPLRSLHSLFCADPLSMHGLRIDTAALSLSVTSNLQGSIPYYYYSSSV